MPLDQEFEDQHPSQGPAEMSFLEHLEELRWHIIRSVIVILVMAVVAFIYPEIVFDQILFGPKRVDFWTYEMLCKLSNQIYGDDRLCIKEFNFQILNRTMSGQFTMHLFVSFITGLIIAFPYILFEIWRFVRPALSGNERRNASGIVFYGSVLFAAGILFGYYFLTPVSVNFMGTYTISEEVLNQPDLDSYITFVTTLTFGAGILFELPLLVYFLTKLGLLTSAFMKKYRRYAFVIILFIAAIVTPPDVASQILMTVPIYALYELGIFIAARVERNKARTLQ